MCIANYDVTTKRLRLFAHSPFINVYILHLGQTLNLQGSVQKISVSHAKDPEERSHSQDLQILVVADGWKKTKIVNFSLIKTNYLSANLSSQVVWLPTVSG